MEVDNAEVDVFYFSYYHRGRAVWNGSNDRKGDAQSVWAECFGLLPISILAFRQVEENNPDEAADHAQYLFSLHNVFEEDETKE